uniref:Uncharacterized protein n=1 Tax=Oryzias melastigma TaxID=30732 RepID=A0A3B3D3F7_ORYME
MGAPQNFQSWTTGSDTARRPGRRHMSNYGMPFVVFKLSHCYKYICRPTEFPCKAGFYTKGKGKFCHYVNGKKKSDSFEILVNQDNIEDIKWKTFSNENVYVGRNKKGLMVVHPREKSAPLITKRAALVATYRGVLSQEISDVKYNNTKGSNKATKTVQLSIKTSKTATWTASCALNLAVQTKFEAGFPNIMSGGVQVALQFSKVTSGTEETIHSNSIQVKVPPQHECEVVMEGFPFEEEIPFTARLTRIYKNHQIKTVPISGMYTCSYVQETKARIRECGPQQQLKD